jgi:outer membrane protein TolC
VIISFLALAVTAGQVDSSNDTSGNPLALTIEDAVEIGTTRSFKLQRSQRNTRIAAERVRGTRGGLGPRVDLTFGADQSQRYHQFDGTFDYNQATPQFQSAVSATASYDLDISGVRKREVQQVWLSQQATAVDAAQAIVDVAADIRTNYVQALRSQQQVETDSDYLALLDGLIAKAKTSQPSTAGFLESERSNAALVLEQSRQNADLTFSNLRQILRLKTDRPLTLTTSLSMPAPLPSTDRLLSIAYEHRGDLKQSKIRLQQARIAKVQAIDSRRPTLRASAFASHAVNANTFMLNDKNQGRTRSAGAMVTFALPILSYDGGQTAATRNIATISAQQARADEEEAREHAETEINQTRIALDRAFMRLTALPDVEQARRSLAQAEQQMLAASHANATSMLAQVTNARQNLRSSVMSKVDAVTTYYTSYYRLQRTLGTEAVE